MSYFFQPLTHKQHNNNNHHNHHHHHHVITTQNDAMVSPWLVSSEVVSAPKGKEPTIIRKSVITTQL